MGSRALFPLHGNRRCCSHCGRIRETSGPRATYRQGAEDGPSGNGHFGCFMGNAGRIGRGDLFLAACKEPCHHARRDSGMSLFGLGNAILKGLANIKFQLFASVSFSLLFIGVRVFYSLVALCSQKASLNPTTGVFIIRLILGFLPELIAALVFIAAGVKTRNVAKMADNDTGDVPMVYKQYSAPYA